MSASQCPQRKQTIGTHRNARVEAIEVVCAAHHEYAVIGFETVYFVEEVAFYAVGDDGVQVLEDEIARRH
jgi:hypothetical protein